MEQRNLQAIIDLACLCARPAGDAHDIGACIQRGEQRVRGRVWKRREDVACRVDHLDAHAGWQIRAADSEGECLRLQELEAVVISQVRL